MSGAALEYTYRYPFASGLEGRGLRLATGGGTIEHPLFFHGRLPRPRPVADMLLALSEVVMTHFFLPRPANTDPVVTANDGVLRFEGFSGCCGAYARADLTEQALDAELHGRGTTNVDFNPPMRHALAALRESNTVELSVGGDRLALAMEEGEVVEKKVRMPVRWIKGFAEVQAYQPNLRVKAEVAAAEGLRFLRALPKSPHWPTPIRTCRAGRWSGSSP